MGISFIRVYPPILSWAQRTWEVSIEPLQKFDQCTNQKENLSFIIQDHYLHLVPMWLRRQRSGLDGRWVVQPFIETGVMKMVHSVWNLGTYGGCSTSKWAFLGIISIYRFEIYGNTLENIQRWILCVCVRVCVWGGEDIIQGEHIDEGKLVLDDCGWIKAVGSRGIVISLLLAFGDIQF